MVNIWRVARRVSGARWGWILAAGRAVEDEQDTAEARNLCTSNSNSQAGYADQGPTDEGEGKTSTTFDIVDAAGKDRYAGSRWTFQARGGWWGWGFVGAVAGLGIQLGFSLGPWWG